MSVSEKVAYLRGLMEGLDLDENSKEGKLFAAIVDALDEMASEISDLEEDIEDVEDDLDELEEYIEEVDEALGDVEEFVYDIEDDCDCCCDDDDCDCCCDDDCDCDGEFFCAMCPSCGEKIYFDESCDPEEVVCPSCQSPLISDEDEDEE